MDRTDWLEIKELTRGAEQALLSGTLNDWQHANTTVFHVLGIAILNLQDRLARLEPAPDQLVADGAGSDE
jgi:hypothetical protein